MTQIGALRAARRYKAQECRLCSRPRHEDDCQNILRAIALVVVFPMALLCGFGRSRRGFAFWAQFCSLAPGSPGDYLRAAYYRLTLDRCSPDICISFGTFFSHTDAVVEPNVYIGAYCVIGRARIGARSQIASHVQIVSGRRQHPRDAQGKIQGAEHGTFREITIGADTWIGASAIVMADVGARTTVGAGSIVTKDLPDDVVAAGNPARVLRSGLASSAGERG